MKKSKWNNAGLHVGAKLVTLVPSPNWRGGEEFLHTKQQAVEIGGAYYDDDGGRFVMGDVSWMLENEYDG